MSAVRMTLLMLAVSATGALAVEPGWQSYTSEDPAKIVTSERCGECHTLELDVWKKTPHAKEFDTIHRVDSAAAIASKMGVRLIKRDSLCLRCHYTSQERRDELRAVEGVSCEKCHGAGRDYITIHNDYGGADHKTEAPEHRQQRITASRAAGMRRASDLYQVAASCLRCHLVLDERLVNLGGHSSGSAAFELVEWSQGVIRHNFLEAQWSDDRSNKERSAERKRVMYVTGRALDLEHSLRGFAAAEGPGVYAKGLERRIRNAVEELRDITSVVDAAAIDRMLQSVRGVSVSLGNRAPIRQAAERIGREAQAFLDEHDGSRLAALDVLVEGGSLPQRDQDGEPVPEPSPGGAQPSEVAARGAASAAGTAAADGAAKTEVRARAQAAPSPAYEKKTHLRPRPEHATIDPGTCTGCHEHEKQNAWWLSDRHEGAAVPFQDEKPKNVQLARLYRLSTAEMKRGNQLCMDCHGTVVKGKERRDIYDGVSCQSCHGPATDYLEPHQQGERSEGRQRRGFVQALELGMRDLQNLETRADNCASCHYITDPGLLSTGHPDGSGFDFAGKMKQIQHWKHPLASASDLGAAWSRAVAARGAIPRVQLAAATVEAAPATAVATGAVSSRAAVDSRSAPGSPAATGSRLPTRPLPPRPRPVDPGSLPVPEGIRALELPPFPEIEATTSVEETLLLIKQRIELLYRAVSGGDP